MAREPDLVDFIAQAVDWEASGELGHNAGLVNASLVRSSGNIDSRAD
jgi:hypothetical protein